MGSRSIDLDGILGVLGIEQPEREYTREECLERYRWRFQVIKLAFKGKDSDAKTIMAMLDPIVDIIEYIHVEEPKSNSRMVVDSIAPLVSGINGSLDRMMDLAVVRLSALGVDMPPHPDQDESADAAGGYMPPVAEAG